MQATATMLVAADNPPMKTKIDSQSFATHERQRQHEQVGIVPGPNSASPARAIGTTKMLISSM